MRFFVWLVIGLVIYFLYGVRHSRLQRGIDAGDSEQFCLRRSNPTNDALVFLRLVVEQNVHEQDDPSRGGPEEK